MENWKLFTQFYNWFFPVHVINPSEQQPREGRKLLMCYHWEKKKTLIKLLLIDATSAAAAKRGQLRFIKYLPTNLHAKSRHLSASAEEKSDDSLSSRIYVNYYIKYHHRKLSFQRNHFNHARVSLNLVECWCETDFTFYIFFILTSSHHHHLSTF